MPQKLTMREYMSLSTEAHRLAEAGRHQDALATCRTLIEADDNPAAQATAHCTRGMILWKDMGRVDEAIADFSRATALNSIDLNSLVWRAQCYEEAGRHSEAATDWEEITRRNVGSQLLLQAREALERLGRAGTKAAKSQPRRSSEDLEYSILDWLDGPAKGSISLKFPTTQDQFVNSCFQFDIVELAEQRDWRFPEAWEMVKARDEGRTHDAIRHADLLRAKYPDFFFPYFTAARMYSQQHRFGEARACLQDGLRLSKSKFFLCAQMGDVGWELGHLPEAVQWWIKSIVLQVSASRIEYDDPFLKLSYVAQELELPSVGENLLRCVDRLTPGQPRLGSEYATKLHDATRRAGSESMRQALQFLHKEYLTTK